MVELLNTLYWLDGHNMIVANFIARFIVWIASKNVTGTIAVTIWPFIFLGSPKLRDNDIILRHERIHLEQWKRYWIVGFLPLYIYYEIKYGYWKNPLELEAYNFERVPHYIVKK